MKYVAIYDELNGPFQLEITDATARIAIRFGPVYDAPLPDLPLRYGHRHETQVMLHEEIIWPST